jgi:hypothetical protein
MAPLAAESKGNTTASRQVVYILAGYGMIDHRT